MDVMEALSAWPGITILEPLHGGNRNRVFLCEILQGGFAVLRHSTRDFAALRWELDLLELLGRAQPSLGPTPILTAAGTRSFNGWHVLTYVHGHLLEDEKDVRLCSTLRKLHASTKHVGQRPGSRSARNLLVEDLGGDIDLGQMPSELVRDIREAWKAAHVTDTCVVHGDAGAGNAIITDTGECVLIDWDEARVDDPLFDLGQSAVSERARLGWEIATCWIKEPEYARSLVVGFSS